MKILLSRSTLLTGVVFFYLLLITTYSSASAPTVQASNVFVTQLSSTSLKITFTAGNGNEGIVVMSTGDVVAPTTANYFNPQTVYGTGDVTGAGSYVVFDYDHTSTGYSVTVTGLDLTNKIYNIKVFEANYFSTQISFYNVSDANRNPINSNSTSPEPRNSTSSVSFSNLNSQSMDVNVTPGSGNYRLIVASTAASTTPVDGTTYTASATYGSGSYLNGYVIYAGSGSSVSVVGLIPGTQYHFISFEYNYVSGLSPNYKQIYSVSISCVSCSNEGYAYTYADGTTANSATAVTASSFTANWNSSNGASTYQLDVSSDNFSTFLTGFNSRTTSSTSMSVTGLSPGTTYQYRVRAVNSHGDVNPAFNSNIISVVTIPPITTTTAASAITQNGFTANWNATSGAASYNLDVLDAGSALVSGYSGLSVAGTSAAVTGLTSGSTYQYRVSASNAAGTGPVSTPNIFTLTVPPTPIATAGTAMTQTSFNANWNSSLSATGYQLDVSTVSNFASFVPGYNSLSVTGNSKNISGLTLATTYYYRLRAVNASGTSPSTASPVSVITLPSTPTANAATAISATGFTANWTAATGASGYFFDLSAASDFSTFVSGYKNLGASGVTQVVSGLTAGATYYYRLRATSASGTTPNSNTITTITIPPAPAPGAASTITQNSFNANWSAANGASGYFLDVSTVSNFSSFVSGYNNKSVSGTSTAVTGLSSATTYYYQIRSTNSSGTSPNSTTITTLTAPAVPAVPTANAVTQAGFTINWTAVSGASNYFLDVSTDNFTTFVAGLNNLNVAATSKAITGLSAGVTYQFRIRSANATGVSASTATASQITIPGNPVATAATLITQNSFNANWNATTGAASYFLDVSAASDFSTFLTGYNNLTVAGTQRAVSGLSVATTYYYRLRSNDAAGTSGNSNVISLVTVPATPAAPTANAVSDAGFTVNWVAVSGAASYFLDVSADNFTTTLTNYTNLNVAGTSQVVTGLGAGLTYQFHVRAANVSGVSPNSVIGSQITIPSAPILNDPSSGTSTSFVASWKAVTGADHYEIDVSADNFSSLVAGYLPKTSTNTDEAITGLSPSTAYRYRIRAVNAAGASANSSVSKPAITSDLSGATPAHLFLNPTFGSATIATNGSENISVSTSGGFGSIAVALKYRKIGAADFLNLKLTPPSTNYTVSITSAMADSLGVEFYFQGIDDVDTFKTSHGFKYVSFDDASNSAIPLASTVGNYEMLSVPYAISDKAIASVFDEKGAYDKSKWRLFHYQGGQTGSYKEYQDGLNNIELGSGYWLISSANDQIHAGAGVVAQANQTTPFKINFEKGWNQIGNPYLFNVDWNAIIAANASAGLNSLWQYGSGGYAKKTVLAAWKGAFVFSDNGGSVSFPVSSKTNAAGRVMENIISSQLDETSWQVPVTLSFNGMEQISAVGMSPNAVASKDGLDELSVPRFVDYLELNTYHTDFFYPYFSTDMVPADNEKSWLFTAASNQKEGVAKLTWDNSSFSGATASLILIDQQDGNVVDMKSTGEYSFDWSDNRQFKIVYNRSGEILSDVTMMGSAYPNPFRTGLTIPVLLDKNQQAVRIMVYNMMGQKVKTIMREQNGAGMLAITWDGLSDHGDELSPGFYLYQLSNDKGVLSPVKRLIKE